MTTATLPKELTSDAWHALYSFEGPGRMEVALDYIKGVFSRLPYQECRRFQTYLLGLLVRDESNGSAPKLKRQDLITGTVIADLAKDFLDAGRMVPDEFYRALEVLPPNDERTYRVLGETRVHISFPVKLARLRDIASAPDAEAAFRAMKRTHGILVPYEGEKEDIRKNEMARLSPNANSHEMDSYWPEEFENFDFFQYREQ